MTLAAQEVSMPVQRGHLIRESEAQLVLPRGSSRPGAHAQVVVMKASRRRKARSARRSMTTWTRSAGLRRGARAWPSYEGQRSNRYRQRAPASTSRRHARNFVNEGSGDLKKLYTVCTAPTRVPARS